LVRGTTKRHGIIIAPLPGKHSIMSNNKNQPVKDQVQKDTDQQASDTYHKLPDNPNNTGESISTADNTANGKDSKTGKRPDEKDSDTQ
jgi:hypothetical protein